ncbi:hypothetical protein IAT38_002473 [Cryptococcus sp. DSM 104549]
MSLTSLRQPLSSLASLPLARPSLLPRNAARPLCRPPSASPMFVRHATVRSQKATAKVQSELKEEMDKQRAAIQAARRNNPNADLDLSNIPLFEAEIDDPKPIWGHWPGLKRFYASKDRHYEAAREQRDETTLGTLSELVMRGGFESDEYSTMFRTYPTWRAICLKAGREWYIRRTLNSLKELYYERMRINAGGTMGAAPRVMSSKALEETQAIIKQRTGKQEWQLISENAKPQFLWARMNLVDPRTMSIAAQVAMTFDTTQALITPRARGKPLRRIVPVKESIVFERLIDKSKEPTGWKVKGRLLPKGEQLEPGKQAPLGVLVRTFY